MKLTVEYGCGHDVQEIRYGGKYDAQLDRAKVLDCPDCFRERKTRERQERSLVQQAQIAELNPVTLTGSPKQIAWATDIRAGVLAELKGIFDQPKWQESGEAVKAAAVLRHLAQQASAKWWIDRREATARQTAAEAAKAEGII